MFDLYALQSATQRAIDYGASAVKRIAAFKRESAKDKKIRNYRRECKYCCHVIGARIAGQAFTNYKCAACDVEKSHPNTGVPKLCDECSDKMNACVRCGADRDMKQRTALIEP